MPGFVGLSTKSRAPDESGALRMVACRIGLALGQALSTSDMLDDLHGLLGEFDVPKLKKNHFISRGLVSLWARPNGQVMFWDKEGGSQIEPRNPKSVHYKDFLYARWESDGSRDMSAEAWLKTEIDDHAPHVVKRLVASWPHPLPIPKDDRRFLVKLIVRTILRHPTISGFAKSSLRVRFGLQLLRIARWLSPRNGKVDLAYERYGRDRVLAAEIFHMAATSDISSIVDQIERRTICILVPDSEAANFVLGSQPFLLNPYGNENDIRVGLVVHPRILLGVYETEGEDSVHALDNDDMKRINGLLIKQSSQVVMTNSSDAHGAWHYIFGPDGEQERVEISVTAIDE